MSKSNQRLFSVYGAPYQTLGVNVPEYRTGDHPVRYIWLQGVRIEPTTAKRIDGYEIITIGNDMFVVYQRQDGTSQVTDDLLNQTDFIMANIYRYELETVSSQTSLELIGAVLGTVPNPVAIPMELRRLILGNGLSRMLPGYFDQFLWLYPQDPVQE